MRKLIITIIVLGVGGLVAWRLLTVTTQKGAAGPRGKPPVAVTCIKVERGDIEDISEFTGTLAGKAEVLVSPKIAGRVKEVYVDMGDEVEEGQLLAVLDSEEVQHDVEEAKAKLVVARAALNEYKTTLSTAQNELDRIQTLRERKVAAVSELESAEAELSRIQARKEVAEASIIQQEAALQSARARLSYTKIVASIDGFIGKRYVDEGAMLSASTPIVSLVDISSVKTVIGVVERDYAKIRVGLVAQLSLDAYPGRTFEGSISRIAPILTPDTRTAETEIEVSNPDLLLKPGMFTRVRINFGKRENVVLVPSRAIVKRESLQGVFIPVNNHAAARFVEVTPGLTNVEYTEVEGIDDGAEIVIMGQHLLNDGDPIAISDSN